MKPWTAAEVARLRRYAARGLSIRETAKLLDRTMGSVLNKAAQDRIAFHGPSGAPPLNKNGVGTRFQSGNTAAAHHPRDTENPDSSRQLPLCRVCGEHVADPADHYRSVHLVR